MAAQLVRLFTCASIISLAGLVGTAAVTACSSDPAAAPAGDDDDTKGDDDDSTSKKDSGASSSGSADAGDEDDCNPIGTWTLPKPTFLLTNPSGVCEQFKSSGEKQAAETELTITADPKGYRVVVKGGDPGGIVVAPVNEECTIGGGLNPIGFGADVGIKDDDGNAIETKISPTQFYIFNGDQITSKLNYEIESVPTGAKGTPCELTQISNGTRKK